MSALLAIAVDVNGTLHHAIDGAPSVIHHAIDFNPPGPGWLPVVVLVVAALFFFRRR